MSLNMISKPKIVEAAGAITLGDLTVNRLGFGTMRVAGPDIWDEPSDREAMRRLLIRAVELGHNVFDTADSYGPGVSESIIAEALYPYPKDLVIATKGGLVRPNRHSWVPDGRPEHLRHALDGSLKRLRLERIDLYQFHAPDPNVPFADSVSTLAELQRGGKIRHIGLSNVNVRQLDEARRIVPIVSVQNQYNVENRRSEDVLKVCEQFGIAFIPWYPIGAGAALRATKVTNVAKRLGATPSQVAIAWLLAHSPVMLPIPGTSSLMHLEENAAAASVKLSSEDVATLD
jgi:aryl-alcohol dehydrogenase-like predicted oxidoreductase